MNKYAFFSLVLIMSASASGTSLVEREIKHSEVEEVRVHSATHPVGGAPDTATIRTSVIPGCTRGVWFKVDQNTASYSTVLAAYLGKKDLYVRVNTQSPEPWGSTDYCELVHVGI